MIWQGHKLRQTTSPLQVQWRYPHGYVSDVSNGLYSVHIVNIGVDHASMTAPHLFQDAVVVVVVEAVAVEAEAVEAAVADGGCWTRRRVLRSVSELAPLQPIVH